MGLSLYEIDAKFQAAMEAADYEAEQNEGVIPEDIAAQLDGIEMEREQKAINICRYIKNLNAEAAAYDAEADRLYKRAKSAKNRVEFLKSWLCAIMPGWKYKDSTCIVSWRKSDKVNILSSLEIPQAFRKVVTEEKIDRIGIKDAIKKGEIVPGAEVVEYQNIQIK